MVHFNIFHLSVVVCGTPGHPRVQVTRVITMARIKKDPKSGKSLPQASYKICTTRLTRCYNTSTSSSRKARNINFHIHCEHQHNIRVAQEGELTL